MIFDGRPLSELTFADFNTLIETRTPEGPCLDYKETAYGGSDSSIREMLRDIVAMANAEGGYLIMGMREDAAGRAEAVVPIPNIGAKTQAIRQACLDGIRERIDGLEVAPFDCAPNEGIIVVHVPKCDKRPFMVSRDNRTDFLRRYDTDKRSMTIDEIRSTFLSNPANLQLVELMLLDTGKVMRPGQTKKHTGPPYVKIFTERSVEQFLHKFMACSVYPQTLVIVSPFISDLAGELYKLQDLVDKITADKTLTYVITRPAEEKYQQDSFEILRGCPYVEVRYNENVHAKLFICYCRKKEENSFALFGSGNLTRGGIRHNLELGMMIFSKDHGKTLVKDLYQWSTVGLRSQSTRIKPAVRPK